MLKYKASWRQNYTDVIRHTFLRLEPEKSLKFFTRICIIPLNDLSDIFFTLENAVNLPFIIKMLKNSRPCKQFVFIKALSEKKSRTNLSSIINETKFPLRG